MKLLKGIDARVMNELGLELGESLTDIILTYVEDTPLQLQRLVKAQENQQMDEVYRLAHLLKSSCGIFGASVMQKKCSEIEIEVKNGKSISKMDVKFLFEEFENIKLSLIEYIQH